MDKNIFLDQNDNELEHYGIFGMKWGIRRYQPYSVRGRSSGKKGKEIGEAAKKKYSSRDRKKREKEMMKDVKNRRLLSYRDLERKIHRIELEKKLRMLTEEELRPGRMAAKKVLADVGKDVSTSVLKGVSKTAIRKALGEENVSTKTIAEYLRPGGSQKKDKR